MALVSVPLGARPQKDLRLTIDGKAYEMHVSSVQWTPSSTQVTWQGGTPAATLSSTASSTWVATFAVIQDYTVGSLYSLLLESEGKVATCEYRPNADEPFAITASITLAAPVIGGGVNMYNDATVACGSTKPKVIRTAVPA